MEASLVQKASSGAHLAGLLQVCVKAEALVEAVEEEVGHSVLELGVGKLAAALQPASGIFQILAAEDPVVAFEVASRELSFNFLSPVPPVWPIM